MFDLARFLQDLLSPLGTLGLLLCIFTLFYIDAIVFPTLPELFTIFIFLGVTANASAVFGIPPEVWFGSLVLIFISMAEILGLTTLYLIVKRAKVPGRVEIIVRQYLRFLIYPDERMILLNRIAPVLPFLGAFVAICGWSYKKSVAYTVIGGMLKYGLILFASSAFIAYLDSGTAILATLSLVIGVLILSFVLSYYRKKKVDERNENSST